MHHVRKDADKAVYENIDPKSSEIFSLANQMRGENVDVVGDKPVRNDAGEMYLSEEAKQKAWLETMRDFSMWNLSGILKISLMNDHLKDHQS